jgi:hypothetical protein
MVANIVMAARPKSDELLDATEPAVEALESADTVVIPKVEVEVELAGDSKPLSGAESVLHGKSIDSA